MKQRAYEILGNLAIVNFSKETKQKEKKRFAQKILKNNKQVTTILEKTKGFSGRLRKMKTKHLAGEKTKEVLYKENACTFRFNIDKTYFSARLSNERKEIANKIKKNDEVLVMFAGVGPFPIVIAKNSKAKKVFSNEINREANKYEKLNIELNKVQKKVELLPGDIKKVAEKLCASLLMNAKKEVTHQRREGRLCEGNRRCPRFDVIVMPRPQLKNSFLEQAFMLSKKATRIFYYDFCKEGEENLIIEKIKSEAKKFKKKIKILKTKTAGEIAPYKIRLRVDFKVL